MAKPSSISLDRLVALNDEITALVRAGVPLDQGLVQVGREMPGGQGRLAEEFGTRLGRGEDLVDILADHSKDLPPIWRAVVAAGVRGGRLSAALEGLSTTARRVAELRRSVGLSLVYPIVIVSLAYAVFVFYVTQLVPIWADLYDDFALSSSGLVDAMRVLGETASVWGFLVPIAAVVLLLTWWLRSGRASRLGAASGWPSVRQALRDGRRATFAELLALLIEQRVAMGEALVLAADASGDREMKSSARSLAERLERGEIVSRREQLPDGFPPLLGWLLATGASHSGLTETLKLAAEDYRRRVDRAAKWNAIYLPMAMTAVIGGGATLAQAFVVFFPMVQLWYALS